MDVRDLDRVDLGMIVVAVGPRRRLFASMTFGAIVAEHGLDLQIHREGRGFLIVMIETAGDAVIAEHCLPVAWPDIDEDVRLGVLNMYLAGVLDGHARWCRRMSLATRAAAGPAND